MAKKQTPEKTKDQVRQQALEQMQVKPDEEPAMKKILADPELQQILSDPMMKNVLEQCQRQPGALRACMQHADVGPKLKKLMEAGLIHVTP